MTTLEQARNTINEIDREMAALFVKRMQAVKAVAAYKQEHGLRVLDPEREAQVLKRNARLVEDEQLKSYFVSFLQNNMELSKAYQHRLLEGMRVAYSGVRGAFGNIAALRVFPDAITEAYPDFKSAYEAVVGGECDCVILPIENSYNGDVGQVMDLTFFGSLFINGVYELAVVQNLLAVKGTSIDEIKTVISHPQALGQCAAYIRKHGFQTEEAVNTAVAAKKVAEEGRHNLAAIGSDEAAKAFGLQKVEAHINESNGNTTRFAVFSRVEKSPSDSDNRFILLFTVPNEAGALSRAISTIGKYGFNMRALKSRPTKDLIWSYYFYVEGEGNLASENGKAMLTELKNTCSNVRVAGRFEKEIFL